MKYSDLVEVNINIFVVDHKVFSKSSTTFSICVPTCIVSTTHVYSSSLEVLTTVMTTRYVH